MKKVTNKCKVCGKIYKLPVVLMTPQREIYCHTCEVIHDYVQGMWNLFEEHYGLDGYAVWQTVRTIDEQANLLKDINEDTSNT